MPDEQQVISELAAAVEHGRPVALATVVATRRSVPRHAGAKMLVYPDGAIKGTIGGGAMEADVVVRATEALRTGRPSLLEYDLLNPEDGDPGICGGSVQIYVEPFMPPHSVYVIGCGHVGKAVVELAGWLGYRTIAIDDRSELVSKEALPGADVRFAGPVADALRAHPVSADASLVVVTRSTDIDVEVLPALLATPARYVGVMGSGTRWQATRTRLIEAGVSESDLQRVHSPIGMDVNAETLEEIAVSILSEIIATNRSG